MMAQQPDENAAAWVPIEALFDKLTGLDDHAKRVIEHRLGPELAKEDMDNIVKFVHDGEDLKYFTWYIGHFVMCVWGKEKRHDYDFRKLERAHVERIERVAALLLSATVVAS